MPYSRRTKDPSKSPRSIVQDAFERAGRNEPELLKQVMADATRSARKGVDPVSTAIEAIRDAGLRIADKDGQIEILPSGKDPALVLLIDASFAEERELQDRIRGLAGKRRDAMSEAVRRRLASEGREHSDDLEMPETHECDGSPAGFCCYDADVDPSLDDCLFCGAPDERK